MKIFFEKPFKKRYSKLSPRMKAKVDDAILIFLHDPFNPTLKNHALKGSLNGKRAFSVTGNFRIIFKEKDGYVIVLMLDLGSHAQVYGM